VLPVAAETSICRPPSSSSSKNVRHRPRAAAERDLVVAVEDPERELVIGRDREHPERLRPALAVQTLLAEKAREHVGSIDLGQVVLVDGVERAEARPHQAEARGGAQRQAQQGGVGLVELHVQLARGAAVRRRLLARADPYDRARVGIDAAEEADLDLAREDAVLAPGERAVAALLACARGEVGDEIAADAHVEEQHASRLGERERLARPSQVVERRRIDGRRGLRRGRGGRMRRRRCRGCGRRRRCGR
jgi:hypothetical protein